MLRAFIPFSLLAAATAAAVAAEAPPPAAATAASFIGRPIYSEPGAGLQLPPGCHIEPTWRGRISNSDFELWVVDCNGETRTWLLRRTTVEMVAANQARLRFQVVDERSWPGEVAGESTSVQCVGRSAADSGFVVIGAKWRPAGAELRLTSAATVLRADPVTQRFVPATLAQVECARYPQREAMMRRLQQR